MSAWQPIETAPKDGPPVLVARGKTMAAAHKLVGDWYLYVPGVPMLLHPELTFGPTHWQPLPAPPEAA